MARKLRIIKTFIQDEDEVVPQFKIHVFRELNDPESGETLERTMTKRAYTMEQVNAKLQDLQRQVTLLNGAKTRMQAMIDNDEDLHEEVL